ncbi:hypothetical protein L210DRAFT_3647405 [Boletus edulis BED1]|uniref:DUF6533 domain-containing protein n=1 Tax=Boletus edulis BED1 TaxID=1328754 RepID=A0AAD4BQX8_BOLED|nr:hypothetical protein L210DRAFT_3647405 [Boletus edulis BED1]
MPGLGTLLAPLQPGIKFVLGPNCFPALNRWLPSKSTLFPSYIMSSDLQSALELLFLNNYTSIIIVVAVPYDYILTFSKEVEYVWCRPWTWVSTMFIIVRYMGLLLAMLTGLGGSSFVSGPLQVYVPRFSITSWLSNREIVVRTSICWNPQCHNETAYPKGTVIYLAAIWGFLVFLLAADVVMILRVYAMWNQSRTILWILLFIYVVQTISSVAVDGYYQIPNTHLSVAIGQLFSFSFCITSMANVPMVFSLLKLVPRLVLAAALVILAVTQTVRQSVEMYKATKKWQLNRYMQLLVRDGIFYFAMNVLYHITSLLFFLNNNAILWLSTFAYVYFYALVPRFIISIRELYDHDVHGRFHIDTGFGIHSRSNVGANTTISAMAFTDDNLGERQDFEVEGDAENLDDDVEEVRRMPSQV